MAATVVASIPKVKSRGPLEIAGAVIHFWFGAKFQAHRLMGLAYLIQYFYAMGLYLLDYDSFLQSWVIVSMPLCGFFQAIIASLTFTFLPAKKEAGYVVFGDRGALSYRYIVENTFFAMLLAFQWLYIDDRLYLPLFRKTHIIELMFVFFPYMPGVRDRWPVSSFRDSLKDEKGVTVDNKSFFSVATYVTKIFYIWAKHYLGFFLNYLRYMDRLSPENRKVQYGLLLGGCWGTTIAMFIHTLKFKGYISARTGAIAYQVSFPWMIVYFGRLLMMMASQLDVFAVATLGLLLNNSYVTTRARPVWHVYQVMVAVVMTRGILHELW